MSLLKRITVSSRVLVPLLIGIGSLVIFYDLLPLLARRVISSPIADLANQFLFWRDYGFGELKEGRFAFWNPYLYSGAPFFGGFQSALLYPLNFPYLVLPLTLAINVGILLHIFLLGLFMYLWARGRGLGRPAALVGGLLIMFSGGHFPHVYAGHLTNLCAMSWVPLIFWAVDGLINRPSTRFFLIGSCAYALHILAGHPQYVYYTTMVIACYTLVQILWPLSESSHKVPTVKKILALIAIFIGGGALAAIQILPGWETAQESLRADMSLFPLPPCFPSLRRICSPLSPPFSLAR